MTILICLGVMALGLSLMLWSALSLRRTRRLTSQFVQLTKQRRATLAENAEKSSHTGGIAPPGATAAQSLHRRNGNGHGQ